MRTDTHTPLEFFRQGSADSFWGFLGSERLAGLRRLDHPKRRERKLGLTGFLWLGLFVAAHTYLPSLEAIFLASATFLAQGQSLPLPPVSVSAFTQFTDRKFDLAARTPTAGGVGKSDPASPEASQGQTPVTPIVVGRGS